MNLPPDPEEMNEQRAQWAAETLKEFHTRICRTDLEDAVADLICDLAHWCDRNNMNIAAELARAESHYEEETSGQGKQFS